MFFATSYNTAYTVPLRFTHITNATSHMPKRYMKYMFSFWGYRPSSKKI